MPVSSRVTFEPIATKITTRTAPPLAHSSIAGSMSNLMPGCQNLECRSAARAGASQNLRPKGKGRSTGERRSLSTTGALSPALDVVTFWWYSGVWSAFPKPDRRRSGGVVLRYRHAHPIEPHLRLVNRGTQYGSRSPIIAGGGQRPSGQLASRLSASVPPRSFLRLVTSQLFDWL